MNDATTTALSDDVEADAFLSTRTRRRALQGALSRVAAGLGLCLALAMPAGATVIVDQAHDATLPGAFSNYDGGLATDQQVADDFSLTGAATLTSLSWVGQYSAAQSALANPVDFRILFFADAGGLPGNVPITTVDMSAAGTPTGGSYDSSPWLAYSIALPSLSFSSGDFWISILEYDARTPSIGGSQWLWGRASRAGSSATRSGYADTWGRNTGDMAFTLEGTVAGVPEPASLALCGLGILAVRSVRRRARTI